MVCTQVRTLVCTLVRTLVCTLVRTLVRIRPADSLASGVGHSSAGRTAALPPETFRFAPSLPLRFACGPHPSNGPEGGHGFRRREPPARRRSTTVSSLLLRGVSTPGREMLPTAKFQRIISSRAQKTRFCARNARKRGFRRPKAHENLDFVLENPKNGGPEGQKRTKTSILCSNVFP